MSRLRRVLAVVVGVGALATGALLARPASEVGRSETSVDAVAEIPSPVTAAPDRLPAPPEVVEDPAWSTVADRLVIPSLDLSVPLGTAAVESGVVTPPTFDAAYVVEGYGRPGGRGTTYVAVHSGNGIEAAGNALIDVAAGRSTVLPGAVMAVDGTFYEVIEVRVVDKALLVEDARLWEPVDGRLVLFTCLQREAGRSLQNVVVVAEEMA